MKLLSPDSQDKPNIFKTRFKEIVDWVVSSLFRAVKMTHFNSKGFFAEKSNISIEMTSSKWYFVVVWKYVYKIFIRDSFEDAQACLDGENDKIHDLNTRKSLGLADLYIMFSWEIDIDFVNKEIKIEIPDVKPWIINVSNTGRTTYDKSEFEKIKSLIGAELQEAWVNINKIEITSKWKTVFYKIGL